MDSDPGLICTRSLESSIIFNVYHACHGGALMSMVSHIRAGIPGDIGDVQSQTQIFHLELDMSSRATACLPVLCWL
jgi:hypothetical protein